MSFEQSYCTIKFVLINLRYVDEYLFIYDCLGVGHNCQHFLKHKNQMLWSEVGGVLMLFLKIYFVY